MTPDEGLLTPELFEAALDRAVEFRPIARDVIGLDMPISLCGLGEPLINKHTPSWVGRIRERGFNCSVSSNAGLLDERRGHALLENGLQRIDINVGETDADYERIYKLPWERTLANIDRFASEAEGTCDVNIVLVDHRGDPEHLDRVHDFWEARGLKMFTRFEIINRGGSLTVDRFAQADSYASAARNLLTDGDADAVPARCVAPFMYPFIGYDGRYYLCCSDWQKKTPMGNVLDTSLVDVMAPKLAHITDREVVCRSCNLDPVNQLADVLRAEAADETVPETSVTMSERLQRGDSAIDDIIEGMQPHMTSDARQSAGRRLIPVKSL